MYTPKKKKGEESKEEEKKKLLHAVERRVPPHTGNSPVEAGSGRGQGQSSADPPCWVNSDTVRLLENTLRDRKYTLQLLSVSSN